MKKRIKKWTGVTVVFFFMFSGIVLSQESKEHDSSLRVGIYDSRSVALAYAGSKEFKESLAVLRQEREKAVKQGNRKLVKTLERKGRKLQKKMHKQAFGTFPVNDILELYNVQISELLRQKELSDMVSVWDREKNYQYPAGTQLDITEQLIDIINPDEQQRKYAIDIRSKKPVSGFTLFFMSLFS